MIGVIRGLVGLLLMGSFLGMLITTWSARRKDEYQRMAGLALDDDEPGKGEGGP